MKITNEQGNISFECEDIRSANWKSVMIDHLQLAGADFSGMDLSKVHFFRANLDGANFSNCILSGANLRLASLDGASFYRAFAVNLKLADVNASEADFDHAVFYSSDFYQANLHKAKLCNAFFCDIEAQHACFAEANLFNTTFQSCMLNLADFSDTDLSHGISFGNSDLYEIKLDRAKLCWRSHELIAELLRREAGPDTEKQKIAAYVGFNENLCWRDFMSLHDPLTSWAIKVLVKYGYDGAWIERMAH
jgi:uncharacterized protein YjbI with pentapeptide repeats